MAEELKTKNYFNIGGSEDLELIFNEGEIPGDQDSVSERILITIKFRLGTEGIYDNSRGKFLFPFYFTEEEKIYIGKALTRAIEQDKDITKTIEDEAEAADEIIAIIKNKLTPEQRTEAENLAGKIAQENVPDEVRDRILEAVHRKIRGDQSEEGGSTH